ncbi:MAG: M1 family metallopeptidase [Ardenticatenaceae bacterium]|nr:M1 family metallopeptidase [Ardenticatenaceae bacterium]MCB8988257.1 M1 family metallopeptidase [Ardenticatenaceae bacterium]
MKNLTGYIFLLAVIFLAACQNASPTPPITAVPTTTDIPAGAGIETAVPATLPSPTSVPTETAVPVEPADQTLFNWNDPAIYRSGLTANAQDSLDLLSSRPVYSITLAIDPAAATVSGTAQIRYTNSETVPLDKVYLHLFPNLLGGAIEIDNVAVDGQEAGWLYEGPNDSMLRVELADALPPGEQVVLAMDFTTAVPQSLGRNYGVFAQVDDVMALAHFYPMVAVYDDEGWHTAPPVEFGDPTFADASFYLVTLTAPSEQVIAGSGVVVGEEDDSRMQTVTMAAGPARDFYLALSPNYAIETVETGSTTIRSYAPAKFAAGARQAAEAAANALEVYGTRLGAYPYTELDIVATPTQALGIEYPGIIAITQREYDPDDPLSANVPNSVYLESTVAHEMGHQWFYNVVGNDQLEEPWLDEALAQYATGLYYLDNYGRAAAQSYENSWNDRWNRVNDADIPIGQPVGAYEGAAYSAIVYGRGPLFVKALAETMGQPTFDTFLKDYVSTYQWDIATTEGFQSLAESHCGCDLTDLFNSWVYENQDK